MKIKLKEDNKNIDNLIRKINEKVIELKKNNFFNNEEVKKDIEKIYNSYIIKWMEKHFIVNNEMSPEFEEKFIDILLDFYNKLNKISNNKKIDENVLNNMEHDLNEIKLLIQNKKYLKENYEDRLGKNLAQKKYFINQAIQNKIANLPPGPPPRTDKQLVQSIEYYQQLVQQTALSPKMKDLVNGVINNIKQHQGLASPKQLSILNKLKLGQLQEVTIGPKKYSRQEITDLVKRTLKKVKDTEESRSGWRTEVIPFLKNNIKSHITAYALDYWIWDESTSEGKLQQFAHILLNFEKKYLSQKKLEESRISDLKPQLVGKSIDEDEFNKIVSIKVPKPIYTEWLLINYIKEFKSQNKSIDDFLKLDPSNVIEFFEKNKNLFDSKDITSYSFNSLNKKVMDINTEVGPASALSTLDLDKLSKAGIKNLGEINGYQIIKIPKGNNSPQAWQTYKNIICQGRTRVCTASNYTRFEYYTTNDDLIVLINAADQSAPYHYSKFTNSKVDKDDQKITDPKILNIIDKL